MLVFPTATDYVVCNRLGRRLDPSALRRRYKRACEAAGLRPVKLHGLRHAAGSLVARTTDAVFVRDFLGHAKLSTTDRYVSAKLRPEELARLDVLVDGDELFLPFAEFPWFKRAPVEAILRLDYAPPGHLHWPELDVDLSLDAIEHPERYPLKSRP